MVESCSAMNCTSRRKKGSKMKFHKIPKDLSLRANWLHALGRKNYIPSDRTLICEKHFTKDDYEINVFGNRVLKKGAAPSLFDFSAAWEETANNSTKLIDGATTNSDVEQDIHPEKTVEGFRPLDTTSNNENAEGQEETIDDELELGQQDQETNEFTHPIYINSDVDMDENNVEIIKLIVSPNDGVINNMESTITNEIKPTFRNRRDPVFFGDFIESDLNDEIKRKRFWRVANETVCKYRKMNKYYQCKLRRKDQKIEELYAAIDKLFSNDPKPK